VLREWSLPLDEKGRVEADEFLHVRGHEHVWTLGDCARCRTRAATSPIRRRASTRSARRGGSRGTCPGLPEPYGYRMLGQVATLGRHKGIAEVSACACAASPAGG
jgi:NADH dehydrogenase, FAD-containing subunit